MGMVLATVATKVPPAEVKVNAVESAVGAVSVTPSPYSKNERCHNYGHSLYRLG